MSSERFRFGVAVVVALALNLGAASTRLFAEEPKALFIDEFDGKARPEWNPVRPDPDLVSFSSHPGKLTLTTQLGAIGGDVRRRRTPLTKNLFLIANPTQGDGDFVVTTCVESFHPTMRYQQAGLLIYDDDDNYLKFDLESNGSEPGFKHMREKDTFRLVDTDPKIKREDRIWFRLIKRGNVYERAYSTDGKEFEVLGEAVWGDGSPQQVGLVACNGPMEAGEIEAQFDFFQIRELTPDERQDPVYLQRLELAGAWDVVSTKVNGEDLAEGPITEFNFDGGNVSFVIQSELTEVDYSLNVDSEPKGFTMSSLTVGAKEPVNGNYSIDDDQLILCLSLPPGTPAPEKLETLENDGHILLTLQRAD
ncbi:putative transmembrane protein [Rhodopirellula islandica]|uniref:Transmembrane protein n=1 Tax=Rhodopirellula islandica TaxID=595434 RepID=A0A0J1BA89_RHOIS|nr:DUF1349 domain-containing protein [Rhodopirellula islandica]KLU03386.1 putative transmembrane protein [Rhodopirellula islandica]